MKQQLISTGTVLGGRFEVLEQAGAGDLGYVYKAKDLKVDKPVSLPVALRVLSPDIGLRDNDINDLRDRIRKASLLTHRNIRLTFGMGVEDDGAIYIATEWLYGKNLRLLLQKRTEEGKRFSFKGAYNILGHVCNGLSYVHGQTFHGSLSPRSIIVNDSGRVKIGDFGLSAARLNMIKGGRGDKIEATFWGPEVLHDFEKATSKADIYSLGALFYELITGFAPTRPLKAPSVLGFSKDVDAVIARCMAANPDHRYKDAATVKKDVAALVAIHVTDDSQVGTDDNLGIDVEFDLSQAVEPEKKPDEAAGRGSTMSVPEISTTGAKVSTIDLGAVISGLGKSEAARWMVQKGKFDHGPFTDRELVQMILKGDVIGKHLLLNMDTGVRKKVKAFGSFDQYLERYRLKKKEEEELAAKTKTEKAEKRSTAFKVVLALSILGIIGLVVGGYFLSRTLRKEKTYTPDELMAAFDSGEIKLKTGGNLIDGKRSRGYRGRRGGGGGSSGGGGDFVPGMSYEEAMNMAVDLGSIHSDGGQKPLSPEDITRIMDKNVRRFLPCMGGQSVKHVDMDIVIAGDGRVIGVSINQGDANLKRCVASTVRSIAFPRSPAPRTAASWYFEIY